MRIVFAPWETTPTRVEIFLGDKLIVTSSLAEYTPLTLRATRTRSGPLVPMRLIMTSPLAEGRMVLNVTEVADEPAHGPINSSLFDFDSAVDQMGGNPEIVVLDRNCPNPSIPPGRLRGK